MAGIFTRSIARSLAQAKSGRVTETKAARTSPSNNPQMYATAAFPTVRRVGKANANLYRNWAGHSEWGRTAVDIRSGQLQRAEWDLVQRDPEGRTPDRGLMNRIREVLENPNPGVPGWRAFTAAWADDLLVLDAGSIEKERMLNGEIAYLWEADGGRVKADRLWSGNPRAPRYYFERGPHDEVPLLNSDLVYQKIHNLSWSPMGLSYFEVLKMVIDAELSASAFNARQITQAAPDGIMDLGETARDDQVERFKAFWQSEIEGRASMAFWGGTKGAQFINFHRSNADMQMMEWSIYLVRKFAGVFQLSPQDFGLTFDVNKSSGEIQQENTTNRGYLTLLSVSEEYIQNEIVEDIGWGGNKHNIQFKYLALTDKQSLTLAQIHEKTLARMPSQSINEARKQRGLPPIGDPKSESNPFNKLMANTSQGLVVLDDIPSARELAMRNQKPAVGGGETKQLPAATKGAAE